MNYTVESQDSISSLAQKFNVPVDALLAANNLNMNSHIFPGMIIIIPPTPPIYPRPPVKPIPPKHRIYIVRRGDTIWSIARRFEVPVGNIMSANNLQFPIVFPGQRLIIPWRGRPF